MVLVQKELKNAYIGNNPIKRATMRVNGVEKQVRPSGWWGWKPWANTVAYYPLNWDINDYSWNNRNLTVDTGSMSYGNLTDGQYWIFNGNTVLSTSDIVPLNSGTILMWAFFGSVSDWNLLSNCKGTASRNYANYGAIDWNNKIFFPYTEGSWWSGNRLEVSQTWIVPTNAWILHAVTNDGTTLSYYKNGSYITGKTSTMFLNMTDATLWCIWGLKYGSQYLSKLQGGMSNIIVEDKARTAQEIADYYDQTKSTYWL
jgi:hypothetical protein